MAGLLKDSDMDQLEQWIGKGPKRFTLLYSITRDGCNNTTFHQKCDNQGPTVTVLYNQQGSVYGGYTGVSWNSNGAYQNDSTAFLFQLRYNKNQTAQQFRSNGNGYSLYSESSYGPTFGGNHDLNTFKGSVTNSGGYYTLNGSINIGHSYYNNSGISMNNINNGTMNVTELEVYHVTDGKRTRTKPQAWRKTQTWNEKEIEVYVID